MRAKARPAAARFCIVSNPGTIFEKIEEFFADFKDAQRYQTDYDVPTDVMRIKSDGELTTEF